LINKNIINDDKEIESIFTELLKDSSILERDKIKKSEFITIFIRSIFKGAF
jgi:hypothetical protein